MVLHDLEVLAAKFGESSDAEGVVNFINNYVKKFVQDNVIPIEVNTDFNYKTNTPIGPIYRCIEIVNDTMIRFVPAQDYFNQRWFTSFYADIDHIATIMTFDKKKNIVRQEFEEKLKTEIAEGKFVDRDTGRIIGADEHDKIRTYPNENE